MPKHSLRSANTFGSGNILWGRLAIWGTALLAVFLVGFIFGSSGGDSVSKKSYDELKKNFAEESSKTAELEVKLANAETEVQKSQSDNNEGDNSNSDPNSEDTPNSYTIKSGDTYWGIAQKIYGDGSLYTIILDANGLTKNSSIKAGDEIEIPPKPSNNSNSNNSNSSNSSGSSRSSN